MFEQMYDSEDLGYSHNKGTNEYILSSKKYKIKITIAGEAAALFSTHIDFVNSKQDETINKRTERVIGIHLYYSIYAALDDDTFRGKIIAP